MGIKGAELLSLVEKYDAPLYVYNGNKIIDKYNAFKNAFKVKDLKVHYAMKALNNISILNLFKELGAGLDCVSIEEIQIGLKVGFDPQDIMYTPNGVSFEEYEKAIALGTKITIDNIPMLEKIAVEYPKQPIFIRLNPHIMAGGNNKISVGHIDSKFGISIHQISLILRLIKNHKINVEGIHIHTGSDIVDSSVFSRVANLIFNIADEFEDIKSIDFGSGFKIQYKEGDLFTDIEKIGSEFTTLFNEYCEKRGRDLTLRFEPGKYLVSESGLFLAKVNVVKQTTALTFAAIDSGFNHFIRPMFYGSHHEIKNISNPDGEPKMYSVVGYICESDTFADDRLLNEVRKDDILLFKNAGAYCFTMISNYNSRKKPAEVLLLNGKDYLIRERQSLDDILMNQKLVDIQI